MIKKKKFFYLTVIFFIFLSFTSSYLVKAQNVFFCEKNGILNNFSAFSKNYVKKNNFLALENNAKNTSLKSAPENNQKSFKINDPKNKINSLVLTISYDPQNKIFENVCQNGITFTSKIPNGFTTSQVVFFNIPGSLEYTLIKNDDPNAVKYTSGQTIKDPGIYDLRLQNTDKRKTELNMSTEHFLFRILDQQISTDPLFFNTPTGFFISKVTLTQTTDGNKVETKMPIESKNYYKLKKDGKYKIEVSSLENHDIIISTDFERVTKFPVIDVTGVESGFSKSKQVTYSAERGVKISVLKDGQNINASGELNSAGNYTLTAKDSAGNESEYYFEYKYNPNSSVYILVLTLILLFVGFVIFFLRIRKHYRIR